MRDAQKPLRDHLTKALDWSEAHIGFDKALERIPANRRGDRPTGMQHSAWELLEHMRLAQRDLLDFCLKKDYAHALAWPDDYWPPTPGPAEGEWAHGIAQFKADRQTLRAFIDDSSTDLYAKVPTGKPGQSHLRSILLVIDHNAYHLGQLISVGQALAKGAANAGV